MEHQRIRISHGSYSQVNKLLVQRELYPNQKPYTKAFYSDPYVVKRFSKPVSLTGHDGCVNTVIWNDAGNLILSGSDDCRLKIWSPFDRPEKPLVHSIPSGHTSNIFSAKFMPKTNDRHIVSCACDGIVRFTDLNDYIANSPSHSWRPSPEFRCHSNMAYEVLPDPDDSKVFFSCAEDGRINKYDLRMNTSCNREPCKRHTFLDLNVNHNPRKRASNQQSSDNNEDRSQSEPESEQRSERRRRPFAFRAGSDMSVTAISIRPDYPVYLAAACGDDTIRIYDQRFVRSSSAYHRDVQVYQFIPTVMRQDPSKRHQMTSLKFDPNGGGDLCASYSSDKIYWIRPGAGLVDNPKKMRKGAVRISKREKQGDSDNHSEDKMKVDNMQVDNINMNEEKTKEENLFDLFGERDTIPTSENIKDQVDIMNEEKTKKEKLIDFVGERDTIPTSENINNNINEIRQNLYAEMQNMNDIKDEQEEYEDDYMYSSDEEDNDMEETHDEDVAMTYTGHLNSRTMIKEAYFFGAKSEYILSGSDDRRIFIWNKLTGKIVNSFIGDHKVVNCVQPHPYYPIICTSGIDYDIKLWYPEGEENDISNLEEVMRESRQENNDWGGSVLVLPLNQLNQFMQFFALLGNDSGSIFDFE
ncbi:WD40 repeat-like protein [Rhizophagus irregularis]|uniref:WD40 repeat-like protein n=1 Tax=Rhizophagus irregularis TaxID=588596 RepID=A0A2N1N092_9GLOM|nr:WD40 repeat-like protein [Rhizophagus irregularis]